MAITFKVGFQADVKDLQNSLQGIQRDISKAFSGNKSMSGELASAVKQAMALEQALKRATSQNGDISYARLDTELRKAGTTAAQLTTTLARGGADFANSLNVANRALATSNRSAITLGSKMKEAARVFTQSFKFTAAQTALREITGSIQSAAIWVKELDSSITQIGVVTGKTSSQLDKITQNVIAGSKELKIAAKEYAQGALIFYQQGLDDAEVTRRNEITIKAAKAAGQNVEKMSSQLTAIWNTYGMVGDEQLRAASVGAKMAAQTAVDFADIAEAMQSAAAPASQMGVEYNQLAAIIATVGDVTQQSASTIGNAYKTIFSRFQQLRSEGTDGEVTLSSVSAQLKNLGINVLDSAGNLRNLGVVINEVGQNWDNWSQTQQTAIAQIVGGTRQYGQFLALMQNFDKYQKNLASANSETGITLESQYSKALDSIEAKADRAAETWRRAFGSLVDERALKGMYDSITAIGEATETFFDAFNGLPGILTLVASLLSSKVGPQVYEIASTVQNTLLSMSKSGRKYTIERDFNQNDSAINAEKKRIMETGRDDNGNLSVESAQAIKDLEIQQKKNAFMRQVAITNEDINNKLKTATGEYRIQLEMQQKLAQAAGDLYQKHLDDLEAIKQQLGAQQQALQNEESRMRIEAARQVGIAQQEVTRAQEEYDAATDEGKAEAADRLTEARTRLADATAHYQEVLTSAELAQKQGEVHTANAAQALLQLRTSTDRTTEGYEQLKSKIVSEVEGAIRGMMQSLDGLRQAGQGNSEEATQLSDKIDTLRKNLENLDNMDDTALDGFIEDLREGSSLAGQLSNETNKILNDAVQTGQNGQTAADRLRRSQEAPPPPTNNNKGFDGKKMAQGLTDITMSAMTVYSSVNLARTAIENLGDKPVQSIVQLTTAAGMGVPALIKLGKGLVEVGGQLKTLISMHPAIAALVAVIAAVAAVSAFFYKEWKNNSPEGQLKKSEEAAEELKTSLEETKQAAEDLRQTFDNYKSARAALDDCIKGTDEWREALQQSNNAALTLINSLDGLSGEQIKNLYKMKDGIIEIDEEQMKMLQHQRDAEVNAAEYASMMGDNQVARNKNAVMAKNIGRDYNNRYGQQTANSVFMSGSMGLAGVVGGAELGAAIGTALGTVVPGLGNAIGAAAGAALGAAIGGIGGLIGGGVLADVTNGNKNRATGQKIQDNLDSLRGKTGVELENALREIGISAKVGTEEFNFLSKSIEELAASTDAANEQMRLISKTAVENALGSAYSDAEKAITAEKLDDKQKEIYNNLIKQMKDNFSKTGDGTKEQRDNILNKLAEATGNTYSAQSNFSRGTDTDRTFGVFENGEEKVYTMEYIASTIAASEALKELEANAQLARGALEGMSEAEKDFIATRSLGGATKGEYDSVIAAASGENGLTQESATEYFKKIGLSDEDAAAYARDLLAQAEIPWDQLIEGLPEALKSVENLTADAAKTFGEQYKKIIADVGEEGGQVFVDTLNGLTEGLDAKKQKKVFEAMAGIDWSAWDAGDQAVEVLKGMNVEVDTSSKEWKNFISTMRDANNAIVDISGDLKKMEAALSKVSDIDYGDIVDKEDYENLKNYNEELSRYFTILADGSAQFTGDKLDFIQATQDSKENTYLDLVKQVKQNRDEFSAQLQAGNNILNGSKVSDIGISMSDSAGEGKYSTSNVQQQLDFLSSQNYDEEQIQKWTEALIDANGEWQTVSSETLAEIGEAVASLNGEFEAGPERISNYNDQIEGLYMTYGMMATTMKEAQELANKALENEGLSKNSDEGAKLYDSVMNAGFENRRNTEKWMDMDPKEVQEYSDHLQDLVGNMTNAEKESSILSDNLEDNAEAAEDVALYTKKMNQGIDKLADGIEDWSDILKNSSEESEEYSSAMADIKNAMSDVLGVSEEFLSDDFIKNNMEDIEKAANGDAEAIDRLAVAAGRDIIMNLGINDEGVLEQALGLHDQLTAMIPDIKVGAVLEGGSDFTKKAMELLETTAMTADQANAYFRSIGFEPNFEFEEVTKEVPGYKTVTVSDEPVWGYSVQTAEDGQGGTHPVTMPYVKEQKTYQYQERAEAIKQTFAVPKLTGKDGKPNANISFTKTNAGAMNNYSSSNRGGGSPGSSSKGGGGGKGSQTPLKRVKKTERQEKERYTDNKNAIEDLSTSINRLSKATDRAFGPQKIRNINLANSLLAQQAKRYQILYKEAKNYQKLDAMDINTGLEQFNAKWGTQLKAVFDDEFLMDNEMEIRNAIADLTNQKIEEINRIEDALNDLAKQGIMDDNPQVKQLKEDLEKIQEVVDELNTDSENMVKKRIASYQEAIKEGQEAIDAIADLLREALENEIQKYTIARDLHLQINDLEQRHWRAIMDNMGEVGKLGKQTADMLSKSLESIGDSVDRYITHYNQMGDVQQRWANRDITLKVDFDISDEAWEQAMQDGQMPQSIMDAMQEDVDALMDLRQQVWDNLDEQWQNYIDSIQYYIDEYDRITDKLTSQMSISDHLLSVIETVGFNYKWGADEGAAQYKNMAAQMDAITVRAKAVKGELALVTNRRKEAEKEMNKLLAGRDYKTFADTANEAEMFEFNRIKAHYDEMSDLETQLNEERLALLDEAYQKASEYAQQWGEVIRHEMDENLGAIFDSMDEAMDVYNQKRDIDTFYMDEVDKTFELNKLQREINEAINDISNPEALERYNKLLAEIEAKKEAGVQMTEKDLEILRAQFDLEQARDAYQDARNAKNTMRLTRDASGNYAYVYSADEAKIEDTQAKIEEAEHNLYKLHRDAADEYAETWLQLQVDWENFIDSIDQARYKQDAEYREMVDQRMAWYSQQSDMLANEIIKHNGAIDRSFADTTLGVITNTQDMTIANETYKQHHTELKDRLIENYQDWIDKADETMREVGDAMSDLEQVVNEETDKMMAEIDDLNATTEKLNEDSQRYLGDLGNFIADWVNEVNSMYDEVIRKIDEVIEAHKRMLEELARQADAAIEAGDRTYDKGTDYNAYMQIDYQNYKNAGGKLNERDWLEKFHRTDIEERILAGQDRDIAAGTTYEDALDIMTGELKGSSGIDPSKGYNYHGGTSNKDLNAWVQTENGDVIIQSNPDKHSATGGLFTKPDATNIAEDGPELVLNASDTQNILNAVKAIRGVVQGQLGAAELGIIAKAGGIAGLAQSVNMQSTPQTVDQNVHIEASFPGVNVAAEVELALNNLIVQAAHYNLNNK